MNPKTLFKILSVSCLGVTLVARASRPHDDVVPLGNDTYSITREASSAFTRDTDKLKAEASDEAATFCASHGKEMRVVSLTGKVPRFTTGYASAKIVFRALNAGDPGLTASLPQAAPAAGYAVAPAYAYAPPPPPAEKALSTDDLYNALVKLDDLRKKGILSDDEFQAEKKKLLNHSK